MATKGQPNAIYEKILGKIDNATATSTILRVYLEGLIEAGISLTALNSNGQRDALMHTVVGLMCC